MEMHSEDGNVKSFLCKEVAAEGQHHSYIATAKVAVI
jgi:hypothetical protein